LIHTGFKLLHTHSIALHTKFSPDFARPYYKHFYTSFIKKRKVTMQLQTLRDVLQHEVEDLYSAETQILEALPQMAKQAHSKKLRLGFEKHLKETREHVVRLEEVAEILGITLPG